jgi:pimeloyl-ACP methyl ester carboxylesterase
MVELRVLIVAVALGGVTPAVAAPQDQPTVAAIAQGVRTIDLRVASAPGVTIAGTLHLPTRARGPVPIAVVIQGHGRNGRHGFDAIITRLTANGIAAFEYDKRGVAGSSGTFTESIAPLTADARAVVAAMRARPELDSRRLVLIGQSQGGVIAPALAASDPTIVAIVTLAGSVGDGLPYLRQAIHDQLLGGGMNAASANGVVDAAAALLQARVERRDAAAIAPLRAALVQRFEAAGLPRAQAEGGLAAIDVPEAWEIDQLRSASDLASLRMPVLAVFGSKDPMVVAKTEAPAARAALANNPHAKVVVLDGLSHWFQEGAVTGAEDEFGRLGPNLGSPRLVALVGDWVARVVERP